MEERVHARRALSSPAIVVVKTKEQGEGAEYAAHVVLWVIGVSHSNGFIYIV